MKYLYERRQFLNRLRFCFLCIILLLSGCYDKPEDNSIADEKVVDTMPNEIIYNMKLKYSEKGFMKFEVFGAEVHNYSNDNKMIFYDSVNVNFFNSNMEIKTSINAKYGINLESEKIMEAKNDVVLINHETKETLYTDHLIWNQKEKKIMSFVPSTIITPKETIYGSEGFESDEAFENWIIRKPSGNFTIEDEEN